MTNGQRVLLVDGLSETEEVLKAVFEPRGLQVRRVSSSESARDPHPPRLMVLHDETPESSPELENWKSVPRVIIGSTGIMPQNSSPCERHFLKQPFQYRELIQAIEQLLTEPSPASL